MLEETGTVWSDEGKRALSEKMKPLCEKGGGEVYYSWFYDWVLGSYVKKMIASV